MNDWPMCPYCGEPLESSLVYLDEGPKLVLFCSCDSFLEIQEQLEEDFNRALGEDDG